jgi:hypothetical protein
MPVDADASEARIYLLEEHERQLTPGGPVVVGPDGAREELPPLVYKAVRHVIEAMRLGQAVKISPFRRELPIDEAADAIGMRSDDLRVYVAEGAIPFRSTKYVDWVQLRDVIEWDRERRLKRREALDELLAEPAWDEDAGDETPTAPGH